MDIPHNTIDLIRILKEQYPDKAVLEPEEVGTPEYWMKMGVVKLLRDIEFYINTQGR